MSNSEIIRFKEAIITTAAELKSRKLAFKQLQREHNTLCTHNGRTLNSYHVYHAQLPKERMDKIKAKWLEIGKAKHELGNMQIEQRSNLWAYAEARGRDPRLGDPKA